MPITLLQRVVKQVVAVKDGDILAIQKAVEPLGEEFQITAPEDALALAQALVMVGKKKPGFLITDRFHKLLLMFLSIASKEGADVIRAEALPWLFDFFDCQLLLKRRNDRDLALLLRIFARMGRREGFERIAQAIRMHVDCGWPWVGIFSEFQPKHSCFSDFLAIPLSDYAQDFVRVGTRAFPTDSLLP